MKWQCELTPLVAFMSVIPALLAGQNLSGTLVAASTGVPISDGVVIAVSKTPAGPKGPMIYKARVDGGGRYGMTVPAGQYQLCVHGPSLYLDPCQWGGSVGVTVTTSAVSVVPLRFQKGIPFVVRVHDSRGVLAKVETAAGIGVSAFITSPSIAGRFPLAVISADAGIRDYGTTVPFSTPLSVTVSSSLVSFADGTGAALNMQGTPFQVLPSDLAVISTGPMFGPQTASSSAKIIHVYVNSLLPQ